MLLQKAELRSRVKVEVDVLGSPTLTARTVSVDVKQHLKKKKENYRERELMYYTLMARVLRISGTNQQTKWS